MSQRIEYSIPITPAPGHAQNDEKQKQAQSTTKSRAVRVMIPPP